MKLLKKVLIYLLLLATVCMFPLAGCGEKNETPNAGNDSQTEDGSQNGDGGQEQGDKDDEEKEVPNPVVTIEMMGGKVIKIELYPKIAPNTVNNFLALVSEHFYDGLIFHRVIEDFMIQAGDATASGRSGIDYTIKGEFSKNGFENTLSHTRGVVSMARKLGGKNEGMDNEGMDSASSQFFIVHKDSPSLDGNYAAFGKVIEGMDVVDEIASVTTDDNDKPLIDQRMNRVTAETFGKEYPEPDRILA